MFKEIKEVFKVSEDTSFIKGKYENYRCYRIRSGAL